MIKQRKNAGTCWDEKEKTAIVKMTTRGNKPESTGDRTKIKKIRQSKTIQTKQDIPKQRKKFYQQVVGDGTKTYQQPDTKEAKQFWRKIWQPREDNKKAEWISNIGKESE